MRQQKGTAAAKRLVAAWQDVPIGTEVIVTMDSGEERRTKTRSAPEIVGSTAVIWLEGISGCYALERVRLATAEPTAQAARSHP